MGEVNTLADLRHDSRNARKHTPRNVGMVEQALREVGAARSIVIDETNTVLAGNATIEAAAQAGIERVRIVEADGNELIAVKRTGLSKQQKAKLALYDNRAAELAEWDTDVLSGLLDEMPDLKDGMFSDGELDEILDRDPVTSDADAEPQMDRAEELRQQWQVEPGQLWQLGDHRLLCGDSTKAEDVARVMGGEKAEAVVTDPPYGINQPGVPNDEPEKLNTMIAAVVAGLPIGRDAVVVAFQSTRTFTVWLDEIRRNGQNFERMLWLYKAAQCTFPWRGWILKSESIVVSSVGEPDWQEVNPYSHDCYYLSEVSGELDESLGWHGSVKPMSVVTDIVKRVCPAEALVYEPFSGSGTTIIACEQTNRKCRAIEIDPGYVAVTLQRYQDATGKTPVKVDDGSPA